MPEKKLRVEQTKSFIRTIKKLKPNQLSDLETAIKKIIIEPTTGDLKVGDLSDVRV